MTTVSRRSWPWHFEARPARGARRPHLITAAAHRLGALLAHPKPVLSGRGFPCSDVKHKKAHRGVEGPDDDPDVLSG
jgi:hypothetical protein